MDRYIIDKKLKKYKEFDESGKKINNDHEDDNIIFDCNFGGTVPSETAKKFVRGELTLEEALKERMRELGVD